jgi:hypothetical protein
MIKNAERMRTKLNARERRQDNAGLKATDTRHQREGSTDRAPPKANRDRGRLPDQRIWTRKKKAKRISANAPDTHQPSYCSTAGAVLWRVFASHVAAGPQQVFRTFAIIHHATPKKLCSNLR